jgi:AP-3 complex subunit delta-1
MGAHQSRNSHCAASVSACLLLYLDASPLKCDELTTGPSFVSHNAQQVKLLGQLVPLEPRLAKKLNEPLCAVLTTTPAKSLLYECVNTLLSGQLTSKTTIRICLDKLFEFIQERDQNLKYLGLLVS